jgi:CRP/FNR family cyclic AMP-dependent transcriptional regulator
VKSSDLTVATPPLLALVPHSLRRVVEPRLKMIRAAKGRTVIGTGSRSTDVFFVVEGQAQVVLFSSNGREVSVRTLPTGELFGELAALDDLPRSASVIATTDVRLLAMSCVDFLACIESSPAAALWLARRLAAEVRRMTERNFELSALNVQSRLHCELLRMARTSEGGGGPLTIDPAPTHAELANRIGSHREAVTREMRALASLDIIRTRRRALEFINLAGLEIHVGRAVGDLSALPAVS